MKSCMFCKFIDVEQGEIGTTLTGRWEGQATCKAGHDLGYIESDNIPDADSQGRLVIKATNCQDYELHPVIIKMLNEKDFFEATKKQGW